MLSRLVREQGYKVVLTGEGSDEMLGGYDIFKETKIRRFWGVQPDSQVRHLLLKRLYPYLPILQKQPPEYLKAFFHVNNFLFGAEDSQFSDDESFLEKGLIDSTGVLELVGFVEEQYGIRFQDDEITPENLDSINRLIQFLNKKLISAA